MTLEESKCLPADYRRSFASEKEMSMEFGDTWAFLALQNSKSITGQRLSTRELTEYLRVNGCDATIEKWSRKLTEAVYVSYDFPGSVKYQTPNGGTSEQKFKF
jgi:hypothetical protein